MAEDLCRNALSSGRGWRQRRTSDTTNAHPDLRGCCGSAACKVNSRMQKTYTTSNGFCKTAICSINSMWCNRYSYGYVVCVCICVVVCVCVCVQSQARSGDATVTSSLSLGRSFVETLLGARPYPKSVDQGRQHFVFHLLYCFYIT